MGTMTSQITSLTIVYSTVYSGADQRKHQISTLLAFVREIHRWPVNSPHKWPVTRKMFSFDGNVITISPLLDCWHSIKLFKLGRKLQRTTKPVSLYSTPSHYHCANLSEGIELIKYLSDIYLSSVWVRLNIFSPLSIIQYVGLYVFSLPMYLLMIEMIYILCLIIIIKSEVWTITHCLGLGHEIMVSAVCLSISL